MITETLIEALRKRAERDITPVENDGYILLRKGYGSPFDRNFIIEREPNLMCEVCIELYFQYKTLPGSELRLFFLENEKNRSLVKHMFFDTKETVQIDFLDESNSLLTPWNNHTY